MGDKSSIDYVDATWNPVTGCTPVSDGCLRCYAARKAHRFSGPGQPWHRMVSGGLWTGRIARQERQWDAPRHWRRPRVILVGSMGDLFHRDVPLDWLMQIMEIAAAATQHTYLWLTKRPARMAAAMRGWIIRQGDAHAQLPPNWWCGTSVEHNQALSDRLPDLLDVPAQHHWLSCEPLLGAVHVRKLSVPCLDLIGDARCVGTWYWPLQGHAVDVDAHGAVLHDRQVPAIEWVVAGGETGPEARPCHSDWLLMLREACSAADVPYYLKQHGDRFFIDGDGEIVCDQSERAVPWERLHSK